MTQPKIPDATTVVVGSDVLASELGSEFVILNLQSGTYYGLEGAGRDIWKLLQMPITVSEICNVIVDRYDVEPERCRGDVLKLLKDLQQSGLVAFRAGS